MSYHTYIIQNKINNKIYVGQTSNLKRRKQEHFKLGYNTVSNKHLYSAMKKYGIDNFDFIELESFDNEKDVYDSEIFWIQYFRSWDNYYGYNKSLGGESGSRGSTHSDATKKLYSEQRQGSKSACAILNEEIVLSVRKEYAITSDPDFVYKISIKYNVTRACIYAFLQNRSWKHVQIIPRTRKKLIRDTTKQKISIANTGHTRGRGDENSMAKLSETDVRSIKKIFDDSDKSAEIKKILAIQFNTSYRNIYQIVSGIRWKHIK